MNNRQIKQRQRARKVLLQSLYQIELSKHEKSEVKAQIASFYDMNNVDLSFYHEAFDTILTEQTDIDELYIPYLDRELQALGIIERSLLRMGSFELKYCMEVPYKVVINEAIRLARLYGATDRFNYINGVLDKVAKATRAHEIAHGNGE